MSQRGLETFGAYRKACELFDFVVEDMDLIRKNPMCFKLVSQQVGSADSICANIILTATIRSLQQNMQNGREKAMMVREETSLYGEGSSPRPSTLDPRP